jgi:hypothetical protein
MFVDQVVIENLSQRVLLFDGDSIAVKRNGVIVTPAQVKLSLEFLAADPGNIDVPAGRHIDIHYPVYRVFVNHVQAVPGCALQ